MAKSSHASAVVAVARPLARQPRQLAEQRVGAHPVEVERVLPRAPPFVRQQEAVQASCCVEADD